MLREVLEISALEDFVRGLARTAQTRVFVFDAAGALITASEARSEFTRRTGHIPAALPPGMKLVAVPADAPPAHVGFADHAGVWCVVAPVYVDGRTAGYVGLGEFRENSLSGGQWEAAQVAAGAELADVIDLWGRLAPLERSGTAGTATDARWAARMLAEWCRRETQLQTSSEEIALVGDIAELLTGEQDLQRVLDRIVAETARVMKCRFASLRLYNPQTTELVNKAVFHLSKRYLNKGAILRSQSAVDDEALNGRVVYIENAATDARILYPDEAREEGIVSMLTAGMVYRGSPVGVIRVYTDRKQRFRTAQKNLLRAVAYQAATAIVHAQLMSERLRAAQLERELELAGALQARMISAPPANLTHLDAAMVFSPRSHVGGDFCDFIPLPDGRLAAVVADVAGKGLPASLLMASTRGALRALAREHHDLGEIVTRLNRQVCEETTSSEFITLVMVAIDAERGELSYCNAGHEPILMLRGGEIDESEDAGLVLGIDPQETYRESRTPMRTGDFLLLTTDGVPEAMNFAGDLFGRTRLHDALKAYGTLPAEQCLGNIRWDLRRFCGLARQGDDITLIGIRVRSGAKFSGS